MFTSKSDLNVAVSPAPVLPAARVVVVGAIAAVVYTLVVT